jgi:hypothetical protein
MEFVSYELSKKLKEKGFSQRPDYFNYSSYYEWDGLRKIHSLSNASVWFDPNISRDNIYFAPTISQVLKWLRGKYSIHISTKPYCCEDGLMWVYEARKFNPNIIFVVATKAGFIKEEQAALAGIEYCLDNLI